MFCLLLLLSCCLLDYFKTLLLDTFIYFLAEIIADEKNNTEHWEFKAREELKRPRSVYLISTGLRFRQFDLASLFWPMGPRASYLASQHFILKMRITVITTLGVTMRTLR